MWTRLAMSLNCPNCSNTALERIPRSFLERLLYRRVLHCAKCGYRRLERRVPFETEVEFASSPHTRCIQCGNLRVRKLPRRDAIDRMSGHPLSILASLARAPIYHCNACRLQYHDWRPVHPSVTRDRVVSAQSTDVA